MEDYSHGRDNAVSQEAFRKVRNTKEQTYQKILELIDGSRCTMEIAELLGKPLHKISGRFSELKFEDRIMQVGKKRFEGSNYSVYSRLQLF